MKGKEVRPTVTVVLSGLTKVHSCGFRLKRCSYSHMSHTRKLIAAGRSNLKIVCL